MLDLSRSISLFALPILCASVASIPMFASAEESTTARESNALIEEIVVTARKRQEPLQDVPASAAANIAACVCSWCCGADGQQEAGRISRRIRTCRSMTSTPLTATTQVSKHRKKEQHEVLVLLLLSLIV